MRSFPFFAVLFISAGAFAGDVVDWLPDLIFDPAEMVDNQVDTTTAPGRVLFRFSSSIPNIGLGPYRLQATGEDAGNGLQEVNQIISRSDDSTFTRDAGEFFYNPSSQEMEAVGWVAYRIREVLPGDGVGAILREGAKQSVRITSTRLHDGSLPNVPPSNERIIASGGNHGISVGYTDIYSKGLAYQWVDVTGLASGEYWIETEVDPADHIVESDESNNIARMKVNLTLPPAVHSADWAGSGDGEITLSELLRVIQIYNVDGYCCADFPTFTDDGFAVGACDYLLCAPHSADNRDGGPDWRIDLSELLRVIQIFNIGGYSHCPDAEPPTEDGFCLN
jgi:hypothetical protein